MNIENEFERLVFRRFKNIKELRLIIKSTFKDNIVRFAGGSYKRYYDNDFQDWEYILDLSIDNKMYYLTLYYAKTRIKEKIIVEVGVYSE